MSGIFAAAPDDEVKRLRPRRVDPDLFRAEKEQRQAWHEDQTAAEREFMDQGEPCR